LENEKGGILMKLQRGLKTAVVLAITVVLIAAGFSNTVYAGNSGAAATGILKPKRGTPVSANCEAKNFSQTKGEIEAELMNIGGNVFALFDTNKDGSFIPDYPSTVRYTSDTYKLVDVMSSGKYQDGSGTHVFMTYRLKYQISIYYKVGTVRVRYDF